MENVHQLFKGIIHAHMAPKTELTEQDIANIKRRLEDENEHMPTWLRAHLMEKVRRAI